MRIIRGIAVVSVIVMTIALPLQKGQALHAQSSADAIRPQIGSVDGQPILQPKERDAESVFVLKHGGKQPITPQDMQEIAKIAVQSTCDNLKQQIMHAAKETQKRHFAISVSPDELARANQTYWTQHDAVAELEKRRSLWTTYNLAASEVFDQGQDSEKVYQTLIAPLATTPLEHLAWQSNLVRWSKPEGRAALTREANSASKKTLESFKKTFESANRQVLEKRKLEDAVDSQLAAGDPRFRTYLDEEHKGTVWVNPFEQKGSSPMPADHEDYLEQKRNEFWMARYAEQQVTLTVPTLADQCNLNSTLGVKVAGSKGM